jgi:hypothetical protein
MKKEYPHMGNMQIYCDDLNKLIDKNGCYDAKGSTICKACLVKPAPKKVNTINKDKKTG